jgi:hypothetical protein
LIIDLLIIWFGKCSIIDNQCSIFKLGIGRSDCLQLAACGWELGIGLQSPALRDNDQLLTINDQWNWELVIRLSHCSFAEFFIFAAPDGKSL